TQSLGDGQTQVDTFSITGVDGTTKSVSFTITGANDGASIVGTPAGDVIEAGGANNAAAGTPATSGALSLSDADAGEAVFHAPASLNCTYGSFSFNTATGVWSYALDNSRAATQALTAGAVVHDTLTVTSADNTAS